MRPFKSTISIEEARALLRDGVHPIERAENVAILTDEWYTKQRACFEFQPLIDTAVDFALLGCDVRIDAPRLACVNNLAHYARVVGDA